MLWNKLPASFRQPHPNHSSSHSSQPNHLSSSLPSSPLSPSITHTLCHSKLTFSRNPSHHRPLDFLHRLRTAQWFSFSFFSIVLSFWYLGRLNWFVPVFDCTLNICIFDLIWFWFDLITYQCCWRLIQLWLLTLWYYYCIIIISSIIIISVSILF